MRKAGESKPSDSGRKTRPALSPEARENQMIALAVDLAERQLRDGTAKSQVITHYLKLGSTRERMEKELLAKQAEMLDAKKEALQSTKRIEELYTEAMRAMREYSGYGGPEDGEDD